MADVDVIDRGDFPAAGRPYGEPEDREDDPLELLRRYAEADNIADLLTDDELGKIGERVTSEYQIDEQSRSEWKEDYDRAMKLALQVSEPKNYPWKNAANIKYPLLTSAAIQFAARAYPAIVQGPDVVKAKVVGEDDSGEKRRRGDRISRHMSWQLMEEMEEWESDTDELLHILPIAGIAYRKTFFSPVQGRNCSQMVHPLKLVVNNAAKSLETASRITQILDDEFYPRVIEERFRAGQWRRIELGLPEGEGEDEDAPHVFLEQYRNIDLDDDGYSEPYIVTVHRDTSQVVRIVSNFQAQDLAVNEQGEIAQIERDHYFTKFPFIPNPNGGFHDIGLGYLLRPINEAVNSTINQLLDAGHLSNLGGGFIGTGARLRGGQMRFRPGEWKPVDVSGQNLAQNMVPLPIKEPSNVLYLLLGTLIDAGKDISSVKDVMTGGEGQGRNASPTTTLALIEQGMQVFSAIYKRVFRSLKAEYRKLYVLNSRYLDKKTYFTVLDTPEEIGQDDYAVGDHDVVPVADPNMVTNMQRLARGEFLKQFLGDPYMEGMEIRRRILTAASIDNPDELLVKELPPDPTVAAEADKIEIEKQKLYLEEVELEGKLAKMGAEVMKLVAEAEAVELGPQLQVYALELQALTEAAKARIQERQQADVDRRAVQGVEGGTADQGVSGVPAGAARAA